MKKSLTFFALFLMLLTGTAYAADATNPLKKPSPLTVEQAAQLMHDGKPVYSCEMKPGWFSDTPGQCPCCTMALEKVKEIKDGNAVFDTGSHSMPMNMMEKK
ncbi:MAG: hypothetical protein KGI29_03285 [Pseudomonadota bacterium]|nr:hypothetical protein [Pseudomonadota bacterium]MDE3037143.1 hypothetical protein [Pseudomonadota bacterium]